MPCVGVNVWMQHCLIPFSFYIHIYYGAYLSVVVVVFFFVVFFFLLEEWVCPKSDLHHFVFDFSYVIWYSLLTLPFLFLYLYFTVLYLQ